MQLSVIITAYNNQQTIEASLQSFINQKLVPSEYELIVVNDGSKDKTGEKVQKLSLKAQHKGLNIHLINQPNQGVAAARNQGAAQAKGELILFTQADIIAAGDDLLQKHLEFHRQKPDPTFALVGHTTWHPHLKITPLMKWLESGGPQFRFQNPGKVNFLNFYTTNVSLKKAFFNRVGGFDTSFKLEAGITAYEDTELGFRLQKAGMQLYYTSNALVYHFHPKDLEAVLRRRYFEGIMSHSLLEKHPDLKWDRRISDRELFLLSFWLLNPIAMYPFKMVASFLQDKAALPWLYKLVTRAWYNWGYLSGGLHLRKRSVDHEL